MTPSFLKQLEKKVIVFDGAMGTTLAEKELTEADYGGKTGCPEALLLYKPQVIEEIHNSFFEVGCDAVETNTFGGSRLKLDEYGLGDRVHEINRKAAQVARKSAQKYATRSYPRYVIASMGPTGMLPSSTDPSLSNITVEKLEELYYEQAFGFCEEDVDAFLIETSQDILETRSAIFGIRRQLEESKKKIPIIAQVTLDQNGRMLLGTDIKATMTILEGLEVDVIGINCSTGPEEMSDSVHFLGENCLLPISCIPNAGMPENKDGKAHYPLSPQALAEHLERFVTHHGVSIVGGCCGTTPEHLKEVVAAVGHLKPLARKVPKRHFVASAITHTALIQEPAPLLVGERVNTQGSKLTKEFLMKDDYDSVVRIAREQVDGGAHVLDICVALTERSDELSMMTKLVKQLSLSVTAPLMIDSTEPEVVEAALKTLPGRGIVNSIHLENGEEKMKRVCPVIKKYGAAVVAMTIDEKGMAQTADKKLAIAKRITKLATKDYGIEPGRIIFDALTFTLATGDPAYANSAVETLEGIRKIKTEIPEVLTILGVSNVSFGLLKESREVLNSVFLYHAVKAGLDMAIVHASKVQPYPSIPEEERKLAEDLIFKRGTNPLMPFIQHFRSKERQEGAEEKKISLLDLPVEKRIHTMVLDRTTEYLKETLDEALKKHSAVDIINTILIVAMKEVGDKFGSGELILPFVLQSAEVMQKMMAHLEPHLEKKEAIQTKGRVLLATVFGDVHDIGKNLVKTILANNGYHVTDLGKQVPVHKIIEQAEAIKADVIGLSALLVSTSKQMPYCVQELSNKGLTYPVVIGGAAINRRFGRETFFAPGEKPYEGGVYYARDAFEGLEIVNQLVDPSQKKIVYEKHLQEAEAQKTAKAEIPKKEKKVGQRSQIRPAPKVPTPPFYGSKLINDVNLREIFPLMDHNTLFRLSWGIRAPSKEEYENLLATKFRPILEQLEAEALTQNYFEPQVVYGYFSCQSDGDDLVIQDENNIRRELARFTFPRQDNGNYLCLSDYFYPIGSPTRDIIALQVVTIGKKADGIIEDLREKNEITKAYYLHGLAVAAAEGLAEWNHKRVLEELGLPKSQGRRYSFGFPACPAISDQKKLFDALKAEELSVMKLTEAFQIVPEQSTSAIVIHHPEAIYFHV